MSFWSEASGITKGAIVVGGIGIIMSLLVLTGVIGGGDADAPTQQTRGLPGAHAAPADDSALEE